MVEIQEDITGLGVDLTGLDEDVGFLFDEQVIQDERLFSLEQTSKGIIAELDLIEDELDLIEDELQSECLNWVDRLQPISFR